MFWLAILCAGTVLPARAAESYDSCTGFIDSLPATVGTQGTWCLRKNLSTALTSGAAITIAANNVTIDCNGFKVGGLAAGDATQTIGIHADGPHNASVRDCRLRGFLVGIELYGGEGHRVEENDLEDNTMLGINVVGPGSLIRGNTVLNTGGSSREVGFVRGIRAWRGVDVVDNTVDGVVTGALGGDVYGIYTLANINSTVSNNRVRGLAPSYDSSAYGIQNHASGTIIVSGNIVHGNPTRTPLTGVGIGCSESWATSKDNVVVGFSTGVKGCASYSDIVRFDAPAQPE
jgi:parallel beta-helix repeat protein